MSPIDRQSIFTHPKQVMSSPRGLAPQSTPLGWVSWILAAPWQLGLFWNIQNSDA